MTTTVAKNFILPVADSTDKTTARAGYEKRVVTAFLAASMLWALFGMLAGVYLAAEMAFPVLNFELPWLSFGRLRTVHTNTVIFGFGGSALIATSFYSVQQTCRIKLFAPKLAWLVFYGWQVALVIGVFSLFAGINSGKEYAEFEWPLDVAITVVWVSYAIVFFGTLTTRTVRPIYVSNWFYGALIIVVAMLHLVNSAVLPVSATKSFTLYVGSQDAIVQWWYGHNAVGFFLTGGFLGMMYYFLPKQTGRPIWSYRLSIVSFWGFVFTYIWAGPHHLHYSAIPDWVQNLAMVMSIILLAPSWGTMVNGIMTLSGAWQKLRDNPGLRFIALSLAFYGLATFEGSMMGIKSVNVISHFSEWTIGHVHSGALGWNAFVTFGSLYFLAPLLAGTTLYSKRLAHWHFYLAIIGVMLYVLSMWGAGITQGLLWLNLDNNGEISYSFVEIMRAIKPYYVARLVGGLLFLIGTIMMSYNLFMTMTPAAAPGKQS